MKSPYCTPSDEMLVELFSTIKNIAVIGLSPRPNRPSHRVAKHMLEFGFDVIPVRPAVPEILGQKAYNSLHKIPFEVDLVDVFRASKYVDDITDQCIDKKVKAMWLQEGVVDAESVIKACSKKIYTVMDRCIYKEYMRLMKQH